MQDALLSRFGKVIADVSYNSKVNRINYAGEKIIVSGVGSTSSEPFSDEVDKVIVTVPLSILKQEVLHFHQRFRLQKQPRYPGWIWILCSAVLLDFKANFWGTTFGVPVWRH